MQIATQLTTKLSSRLTLVCISLMLGSCGFHLQGQNQAVYPATLSLYTNDSLLGDQVGALLQQQQVEFKSLKALNTDVLLRPQLSLTNSKKNRSELILDDNGDVTVWRYTLSTHYVYQILARPSEPNSSALTLSVSTDVDLSSTQATVNERIEADSWALLYRQLATRIMRQLSRQE